MSSSPRSLSWQAATVVVVVLLMIVVAGLVAACGTGTGVGDGGAASTGSTSSEDQTSVTEPAETTSTETPSSQPTGETTTTESATASTDQTGSSVVSPSTTPTTSGGTMTVNVYFLRDEKMAAAARVVPKTQSVGTAAVRALLQGPTAKEKAAGMSSTVPQGTSFLGLTIKSGIATVDLSKEYSSGGGSLSMTARLAQVVFTLTQFPSVKGVEFMLDGKPIDVLGGEGIIIDHPMTRADYESLSPAILVESPTLGVTTKSPVRVTGTANVFEAVFRVNVVDRDGLIIADQRVQASSGTGTRGTFDVTVVYPAGHAGVGSLIVFENSAKDGKPTNVVEIPIVLK